MTYQHEGNIKIPVKRLSQKEFKAALEKGQGRATLHVIQFGLDDVKDLVLEACLHNQVYDQQIESNRGKWLFNMFQDSPHFPEFRDAIFRALEVETNYWDIYQLCSLVREIAVTGNEEAHQRLKKFVYRNAANSRSEDDFTGSG